MNYLINYLFLILFFVKISSFPLPDERIYFPSEEIDDSPVDLKFDQLRLLGDSNILKSENTTKEFLIDETAQQRLENGQYFQGDILLMQDQLDILKSADDDDEIGSRTGLLSEYYRWPKDKSGNVIVPYEFSEDYTFVDRTKIYLAMRDLEKYTCVQYKPRESEEDYIYIQSGRGCASNLGKIGGRQKVTLQRNGCLTRGTIIHELIHALGYDHMHSHADRDYYVTIVWDNIESNRIDNFDKVDGRKFSNFGTPYDFYSVMHYTPTAFSKNGKRTIVPKDPEYRNVIGQRVGMSPGDANRVNNMYKCFT